MSILKWFKKKEEPIDFSQVTRYLAALEEKHRHIASSLAFKTDKSMAETGESRLKEARRFLHDAEELMKRSEYQDVEAAVNHISLSKQALRDYQEATAKLNTFTQLKEEATTFLGQLEKLEAKVSKSGI